MSSGLPGFFVATAMPDAVWWEALWPNLAGLLSALGLEPGMEVVDLCSGDGWFTLAVARIAGHVTAIDIDPKMLEEARRRLAENGVANCDFVAGDANDVERLATRPADFVLLANVFHGVPDRTRLTRAVAAVLKPSGRFAIINWHQQPREQTVVLGAPRGPRTELRMSPQQTIEAVEAGGLIFAQYVEAPPYHYGLTFKRPA